MVQIVLIIWRRIEFDNERSEIKAAAKARTAGIRERLSKQLSSASHDADARFPDSPVASDPAPNPVANDVPLADCS